MFQINSYRSGKFTKHEVKALGKFSFIFSFFLIRFFSFFIIGNSYYVYNYYVHIYVHILSPFSFTLKDLIWKKFPDFYSPSSKNSFLFKKALKEKKKTHFKF